jgi:4-diphosphocytidyl-2-C-methyl-D-erythritol kinase
MLAFANAKINLGLLLTEKRADGYHNLETVFYPINLFDVIELVDSEETVVVILGLNVPGDVTDNLCLKAFRQLQIDFNLPNQQIILLKNIPIGAGLGGGSSDAAFLIQLVNSKFELNLSTEQMQAYARGLGADCSFFIENKPVFAYAKGDEFENIKLELSRYYKVLVMPSVQVSTADAYKNVKVEQPGTSLKDLIHLPVAEWKNVIVNDFEPSVFQKFSEIDEIKTKLYAAGATFALMSGSGSSVYALFDEPVKLTDLEKDNQIFYGV